VPVVFYLNFQVVNYSIIADRLIGSIQFPGSCDLLQVAAIRVALPKAGDAEYGS
jgi:hypothetical protein